MSPFDDPAVLQRFAELTVRFAANVQPDQVVAISAELGKQDMVRALAAAAYGAGARFVDAQYFDPHVKRARIDHAREETLDFVPGYLGDRLVALGELRAARIGLTGPAHPTLFEDADPARAAKDQLPSLKETGPLVNARTTNWALVPCPTRAWASYVFPELEADAAWARLGELIMHVCRLDEEDPIASWAQRREVLMRASGALTGARFDAVRFRGEGTDLTVGLLPTSAWITATFETVDGIVHMPNLPSEEIFTSPDPTRTEGVVRATKPLVLGGSTILGLEVEFRAGDVVRIDAEQGADVLRGWVEKDAGARRLGEVALVDGEGRIGALDTVFFDTLLDENAASHIALGSAYALCVEDPDVPALNVSAIHVDFMIGSDSLEVDGLHGVDATPVLRGGAWQL